MVHKGILKILSLAVKRNINFVLPILPKILWSRNPVAFFFFHRLTEHSLVNWGMWFLNKLIQWRENQNKRPLCPHSGTLAWKIPWVEEPGRLQSRGLLRVGHDWATSLSLFTFMHWRRKWQPTPVFLPGESWGRGSLVGSHLWGCTESDTTGVT